MSLQTAPLTIDMQDSQIRTLFRSALVLVLGVGVFTSVVAMSPDDKPAATVGMTNMMSYTPDTVRVAVGETVRWENSSDVMHTVTADPDEALKDKSVELPEGAAPFHSGNLNPEDTFQYTFEAAGTYRYFCIPHEAAGMKGTVIVSAAD